MRRRPSVHVLSAIPKLAERITENCSHLASEIINVDCSNIHPEHSDDKASTKARAALQNAEVIVSDPAFASLWMAGLGKLKYVQSTFAGVDRILREREPDIVPSFTLSRCGEVFGNIMAEYVVGQIVGFERNSRELYKCQEVNQWCTSARHHMVTDFRSLDELSIAVLGVGECGGAVAKYCKRLGMTVWGMVNNIPKNKSPDVDQYRTSKDLVEVLSSCEYVCNVLPSTPHTRGMLDSELLKHCSQKQCILINIGRGDICTEASIVQALDNAWIGGAILDVFPIEPLPSSSLLWSHPKVTITPHVSGVATPKSIARHFARNLERFVKEEPLEFVLDWSEDY